MIGIYFSGTGNTKFCLSQFLGLIDNKIQLHSIEDKSAIHAISEQKDIVFAYPVYYSNLPKIVLDYIQQNASLWRDKNIYIIATMGLFSGDGAGVSARLFRKCGANIIGGLHVKMPDCVGDVKALKKPFEKNKKVIETACKKIERAVHLYLAGNPTNEGLGVLYHIAGLFGQRLYFYNKTKHYTDKLKINNETCIGCGVCTQLCPMSNIQIENGKAASSNRCTMCYRCFSNCPQKSITLIGKNVIEQHKIEQYL